MNLIPINNTNILYYKYFESNNDLSKYQSRIYPDKKAEYIRWYYIEEDHKYIGSVWLEKYKADNFAKLGIFIADKNYRGRKIGREAIQRIIEQDGTSIGASSIILNVRVDNVRAQKAYRACGFEEEERIIKASGISAIRMRRNI